MLQRTVMTAVTLLLLLASSDRQGDVLQMRDAVLSLLQLAGLSLTLVLVWQLLFWLSAREGTIIVPFENATTFAEYSGGVIADASIAEVQRISDIRVGEDNKTNTKDAHPPLAMLTTPDRLASSVVNLVTPDRLAETLAGLGTVGFSGTKMSVESALMTLKRVWPLGRSPMTITGSLQSRVQ